MLINTSINRNFNNCILVLSIHSFNDDSLRTINLSHQFIFAFEYDLKQGTTELNEYHK